MLRNDLAVRETAASMHSTEIEALQKQLSDSTAKVLGLSKDLTSTEETYTKAVQVLLCIECNCIA